MNKLTRMRQSRETANLRDVQLPSRRDTRNTQRTALYHCVTERQAGFGLRFVAHYLAARDSRNVGRKVPTESVDGSMSIYNQQVQKGLNDP